MLLNHKTMETRINKTLQAIGNGTSSMSSGAYDTGWVARLAKDFPHENFDVCLEWLREHQHQDGSWGATILHYHDRFISTLSAIIALRISGNGKSDEQRIQKAEKFLWYENGRLTHDAHDTVGYPILIIPMMREAHQLGLDIPHNLYLDIEKIERKLDVLAHHEDGWYQTTLAYSAEGLRKHIHNFENFKTPNGSIATSPAATVASLVDTQTLDQTSIDYLKKVIKYQGDGGIPSIYPCDIFESVWVLNHIRLSGAVLPSHPEVKRILDFLYTFWTDKGINFSTEYPIYDLDDTAVAFTLLKWGGYDVSAEIFLQYEGDDLFYCYEHELDPSTSVNIRTLVALQTETEHPNYDRWIKKIKTMIRAYDLNGYFWFDKWHISPYYLTSTAIWSLQGFVDNILPDKVKWILKTQNADGGWGYYNHSTAEETAYCLQALLHWDKCVETLPSEQIIKAGQYLLQHANENPIELWIGKGLYTPHSIVNSAIDMALYSYLQYTDYHKYSYAVFT